MASVCKNGHGDEANDGDKDDVDDNPWLKTSKQWKVGTERQLLLS